MNLFNKQTAAQKTAAQKTAAQPTDAQPTDAQPTDAQPTDAQSTDANMKNPGTGLVASIRKGVAGIRDCYHKRKPPNNNELNATTQFNNERGITNRKIDIQEKMMEVADSKEEKKAVSELNGLFKYCLSTHEKMNEKNIMGYYLYSAKTGKVYPNSENDPYFITSLGNIKDSLLAKQAEHYGDKTGKLTMAKTNVTHTINAIEVIKRAIKEQKEKAKQYCSRQPVDIEEINVSLDGEQKNKEEVHGGKSRRRRAKSSKRTKRSKARKSGKKSSKRSTRKTRRNRRSKH